MTIALQAKKEMNLTPTLLTSDNDSDSGGSDDEVYIWPP